MTVYINVAYKTANRVVTLSRTFATIRLAKSYTRSLARRQAMGKITIIDLEWYHA